MKTTPQQRRNSVYKGHFHGELVAVKVLEPDAVARRDPATGACLEAVLSEGLSHPNVVRTLAWRVVTGEVRGVVVWVVAFAVVFAVVCLLRACSAFEDSLLGGVKRGKLSLLDAPPQHPHQPSLTHDKTTNRGACSSRSS